MPTTEASKLKIAEEVKADKIAWLKNVIKAAGRYERLMSDPDFKLVMDDLKNLAGIHQDQITGWLGQLEGVTTDDQAEENPVKRQQRIFEVIKTHQYRLNQLREAIAYPDKIIHAAIEARTALKELTAKEETNG